MRRQQEQGGGYVSEFETDTAVTRVADNRFRGKVDAGWNIADNPNGGYLLAIIANAISQCVAHPDPLSVTTHYLRPGIPDAECEIDVDIIRQGRTVSTLRATMVQEGKPRLAVLAAYGDLSDVAGVTSDITLPAPDMPAPEECIPRGDMLQGVELALIQKMDLRLHPDHAKPGHTGVPEMSGCARFTDGREPDTRALLLFCDSFPPSVFGKLGSVGWVPTIELTVHIRRRPSPGWIFGVVRTDDLVDGRMIESGSLWDSQGKLVAECRQLGLVLPQD